jgi:hypothetical protein
MVLENPVAPLVFLPIFAYHNDVPFSGNPRLMKHNAPYTNLVRAVVRVACILGMPALPALAQDAALSAPPTPKKIINYGGGGWKDGQVQEPCILVNPKDARKLIMFYAGMNHGGIIGCLGKAWANVSDPFTWHEDAHNPLLRGDPKRVSEAGSIRLDSVVYDRTLDQYWIYYTGGTDNAVNLAVCPAGKDGYSGVVTANIKRYKGNPVLSPKGQGRDDGYCVSQGAVFRENGLWYLFYSYRNGNNTLPGIRLATSRDGKRWTKAPGPDLLTSAPEQRYIEWHQVYKIGKLYVMLYEGYNGGTRWGADVATSSSLTAGWKKVSVNLFDQTKWPAYSDETMFHVATPAIYNINDKWYMYFQAAHSGDYGSQHWALWCIECDNVVGKLSIDPTQSNRGRPR